MGYRDRYLCSDDKLANLKKTSWKIGKPKEQT